MEAAIKITGVEVGALTSAKEAIVEILKAAGTENAQVAAVNCLASIVKAPANVSVANCSIVNHEAKPKGRR